MSEPQGAPAKRGIVRHGDECADCDTGFYSLAADGTTEHVFRLTCNQCGIGAYFPRDGGPYPPCCAASQEARQEARQIVDRK